MARGPFPPRLLPVHPPTPSTFVAMRILIAFCCTLLTSLCSTSALAPVERSRRQYFGDVVVAANLGIATATTTALTPALAADTLSKLKNSFPGALSNDKLLERVTQRLARQGFAKDGTLVGSSLCSDEVNRPLEDTFLQYYGNHFAMGGLAGFPFSGVTGFGAMASHIPDNGNCLLVYGPHVGVDSEGNVGKVNRRGKTKSGTCCGSAVAASKYLAQVIDGAADPMSPPSGALDAQQTFVSTMLLPYASEVIAAKEPMVTLPYATFKPIDNMMNRVLANASSKVGPNGKIAMLGGIQVRTNSCRRCTTNMQTTCANGTHAFPLFFVFADQHTRRDVGLLFAASFRRS